MNHNETIVGKQIISTPPNEHLSHDLRQAIHVINAEYQQIDWEDQVFLNRVLTNALQHLEAKEVA